MYTDATPTIERIAPGQKDAQVEMLTAFMMQAIITECDPSFILTPMRVRAALNVCRYNHHYAMYDDEGYLIAAASVAHSPEIAEIESIAVERGYRGKGLGHALVKHIGTVAAEEGARYLQLKTVNTARAAYERMGFVGQSGDWMMMPLGKIAIDEPVLA